MAKEAVIAARLLQFWTRLHRGFQLLAHPKNVSFWRGHKLHLLVALLVLTLHGALVYALWRARVSQLPPTPPVAVRLINEPAPTVGLRATPSIASPGVTPPSADKAAIISKTVLSAPQPLPIPVLPSVSTAISVPSAAPAETMATAASVSRMGDAQPNSPTSLAVPVGISGDVSLACPVRAAPVYPLTARKLGETGKVVLRIELDEAGRLVASDVARSSGFARLDEAAQAAVKSWRCHPAMRDGQALRIVSLESFDFRLGD